MSINKNNQSDNRNQEKDLLGKYIENGVIDIQETIIGYDKDNRVKTLPTTTQLRLLMSNSVVVKNKIEIEENEFYEKNSSDKEYAISDKMQGEIKYLLIKHIYQCGREEKLKKFDKIFGISKKLKEIENSKEKFDQYYRYLEEIIAYIKYYNN